MTHHTFLTESKQYYINVIRQLANKGAEGVILGCTEIKMLIAQEDIPEVQLFDTTFLHCELASKISVGEVQL